LALFSTLMTNSGKRESLRIINRTVDTRILDDTGLVEGMI